jgi:hypothetical protein
MGGAQIDAMGAMLGFEKARHRLSGHARQHPAEGFDQRDGAAELAQHGGGLEPDIAAADNDDLPDERQLGNQPVNIGTRADIMDSSQIMPAARQTTRPATGRPDQVAIGKPAAILEADAVGRRLDSHDRGSGNQVDRTFRPIAAGANEQPFERFVAGKIFLGQWRALVRRFGLVADQRDRAGIAFLPQRHRGLGAAMTGSHDGDVETLHAGQSSGAISTCMPSSAFSTTI